MKRSSALALLFAFLSQSCISTHRIEVDTKQVRDEMTSLIGFFNDNAFDPRSGAYYSEIDNKGAIVSDKIYTVALSRAIYALAYSSSISPENLSKAQAAAQFQLNHMLGEDEHGSYFLSWVRKPNSNAFHNNGLIRDENQQLDIWQQAYGLNGMVELYRQTHNEQLLHTIRLLHKAFVERFRDPINLGFVDAYEIGQGQISQSKSIQSLMYPVTAYMANLWMADIEKRREYEIILKEHITLLSEISWNEDLHWVNVKYDKRWQPCESTLDSICSDVSPGHNFQLAALFLRASKWPFLSLQKRMILLTKGQQIISATLAKQIYGQSGITQGFAGGFNPLTNLPTDERKAWWQHCEAIIALSLHGAYRDERDALLAFFFEHFSDSEYGGEFSFLNEYNEPVTSELKGSIGKSMYHTVEMIRFL